MTPQWECEECFHLQTAATAPRRCPECGAERSFWPVADDDGDGSDDHDYDDDDDEEED